MQYMFLRDLVGTINRDDQIANYEAISDALHYLNKEGQTDFDDLKMGYLRKTLSQNELRFMNWHLHKCADCRKDLKFKAVVRNGLRTRKKAAEIFIEDAKANKEQGNFKEAIKCLNEALELRPWDEEIEARIAGLVKENIEVYINNIPFHKFTVSDNKLFIELYSGGNAKHVRVLVKYLDQGDYFFVDLSHNDILYYDLAASTAETKEVEGKILEISSKKEKDASSKIILINAIYRRRVPYKVVFDKDTDCADLVVDLE